MSSAEQSVPERKKAEVKKEVHPQSLVVPTEKSSEAKTLVPPDWEVEESDKKPAATAANWDVYPMVYKEYVDGHVKRVPSESELSEIHEHYHPVKEESNDVSVHPQEWKEELNKDSNSKQ